MFLNPLAAQRPCACAGASTADPMTFNFGLMAIMMSTMMSLIQQCFAFAPGQAALPGNATFGRGLPGAGAGLDGFLGDGPARTRPGKSGTTHGPGKGKGRKGKARRTAGASGPAASSPGASDGKLAAKLPKALKPYAADFEKHGKKYGVDPRFLAAISMMETGNGTSRAFRSGHNAMGVSDSSGPISFKSVGDSIEHMARVLGKKNGVYAGKSTIRQIAAIYCPVGAGNDVNGTNGEWPSAVSKFFKQLGGNPNERVK